MNKNIFSDSKKNKSPKGFYTALAISAIMIGSACYFSYSQNEEKSNPKQTDFISEEAVDRKVTNIPKQTTALSAVTSTVRTTTTTGVTTTAQTSPVATIPAADPIVVETTKAKEKKTATTEFSQPLDNMSNILNMFSGSELVKNTTTGSWQTHNGTDIAAASGDSVYACADGEVTEILDDALWGTVVVIDHKNGYISKYANLAKDLNVQVGNSVKAGNLIGAVGDTADIESGLGTHLHFEILKDGKYVNPLEIIK